MNRYCRTAVGRTEKARGIPICSLFSIGLLLIAAVLVVPETATCAGPQGIEPEVARLIREVPITQGYRDAGAVILFQEEKMTVGKGGLFSQTMHVIGKVLDERAASDYSQISISFNAYYEDASLTLARTIQGDGTARPVSGDAVQTKTSPRGKEYSDMRLLTFSLPALAKGSIFEYEAKIQRKIPLVEDRFDEKFFFHFAGVSHRVDPVFKSRFVLMVPEGTEFHYKLDNAQVVPAISKEGSFVVYAWEIGNLPSVALEPHMPPIDHLCPHIHVSSVTTWEELAQWGSKLFLPAIEVTPEIRAKSQEITKGKKTEYEKIEAIFYFMESNIKYVAADLNRGGFKPHAAHEVLKNLYGDCKDQATLFVSLLRSAGIEAHPALINSYFTSGINEMVPSPDFNHMIVYIPREGEPLWLDTTPGITRFPELFWPCQDQWSLVIDGQKGKLVKTPSSKPGVNKGKMSIHQTVKGSAIYLNIAIDAEGALGDSFKAAMKPLPPDRRREVISDSLREMYKGMGLTQTVEISDVENPRLPFRATAVVEFKDAWPPANQYFYHDFNIRPLTSLFTSLDNLPQPDLRKNAYWSHFPCRLALDFLCAPPAEGMRPEAVPKKQSLESPFFILDIVHAREGQSVRSGYDFVIKQARVDRAQYSQFYDAVEEALKKSRWRIVFSRLKGSDELEEAVQKEPGNTNALLSLAKDYLRKGKYREAKEVLDKSALAEPDNGEVQYYLGISCGYLDLHSESKNALSKAKALGYKP